ncbi:MAG: hypothetical protein ACRDD8_06050 [Bacteroidales bacterium]
MNKNIINVSVTKLTDRDLMLDACECTFNGKSKQSLLSIYKSEHSPARTQLFWIKCENIPLFVSTHLLRHHVGLQPFALTHRVDRPGGVDETTYISNRLNEILSIPESHRTPEENDEVHQLLIKLKTDCGRLTPTTLGILVNAQSLIDMAKLRECYQASAETRYVFKLIKNHVGVIDPDLRKLMVKKCVYRNALCGEPMCCGYNNTDKFKEELESYLQNFSPKQKAQK